MHVGLTGDSKIVLRSECVFLVLFFYSGLFSVSSVFFCFIYFILFNLVFLSGLLYTILFILRFWVILG